MRPSSDLDAITRRLRKECPWDREQDERTIVPHTLEEAYELADAAQRRDDAKLLDELGDVLFQVHFLALLLEERGAGDLAQVAEHCTEKLIRRHPHVFGEAEAATAGEVLRNWDRIKQDEPGREPGVFGEVPENLPVTAVRAQGPAPCRLDRLRLRRRRAADPVGARRARSSSSRPATATSASRSSATCCSPPSTSRARLHLDPELALRGASDKFRRRVLASAELAASEGRNWNDLRSDEQLAYYAQARLTEGERPT